MFKTKWFDIDANVHADIRDDCLALVDDIHGDVLQYISDHYTKEKERLLSSLKEKSVNLLHAIKELHDVIEKANSEGKTGVEQRTDLDIATFFNAMSQIQRCLDKAEIRVSYTTEYSGDMKLGYHIWWEK